MVRIAIVGNIASGKSTVEKILASLGYKVLDTDKVCHNLLLELEDVEKSFKDYDVFEDNVLSREKLGKLVFSNPELKSKLENILYPELRKNISEFNSTNNITFVAIPLLFEAGMEDLFDKILFVYCDDKIRLERLIKRNNYTEEYAKIRMDSQVSQDEKVKKADFVIYNNSSVEDLEVSLKSVLEQIR